MSIRNQRMLDSAPYYYQYSQVYMSIIDAAARECDSGDDDNEDIRKQLYILTATWGLKYWENTVGLPVNENDSYDIRRSRVLARWRSVGNFSAALVQSVCLAFTNGHVSVSVDPAVQTVNITFIDVGGIPSNMNDLKAAIDNIIHAHLGVTYEYSFTTFNAFDVSGTIWDNIDVQSWDVMEVSYFD